MNLRSTAIQQLARVHRSRQLRIVRRKKAPEAVPRWQSANGTYLICTNPRSGSWLLSEGLASTCVAGIPREWFNTKEEQQHRARWRLDNANNLSCTRYLEIARAKSTTRNGISGIKLHYYQFMGLPRQLETIHALRGLSSSQLVTKLFPGARYLWLTRRDKRRQAISYLLASGSDQWWRIAGIGAGGRRPDAQVPTFDAGAIARREQRFQQNDRRWRQFFSDNHIQPYVVHYEDLAADYRGNLVRILEWLGVPDANCLEIPAPRLLRQSDSRNEEWLARYETALSTDADLTAITDADETAEVASSGPPAGSLEILPPLWKQWVGQSRLLRVGDEEITQVLIENGYNRGSAVAELSNAGSDPYLAGAMALHQRQNKAAALINIQAQLARLDSKHTQIERRQDVSREEFRDRYYAANRPVILTDLLTDWRALSHWSPQYLKSVAADAIVEVMAGREADPQYELNGSQHRVEMRFGDYVDRVYSGKVTNDYYMVANNGFLQRPEAQPLLEDFAIFPQYLQQADAGRQCFLWFGPAGTITPLHHDTSNILLAQVVGRKLYRLIPATQWQYVYNNAGVFSDVDCERPDLDRHPKFAQATVIDIILEPGEVLFMPVGWWHHVRALEVSMTVSFTNFLYPNHYTWS